MEQVLPGRGKRSGEVVQKMCTHVSKCKNDKIKKERKNNNNLHQNMTLHRSRKCKSLDFCFGLNYRIK
jgi:hypothetical protein